MALAPMPPHASTCVLLGQYEWGTGCVYVHITMMRRVTYVYRITYMEFYEFYYAPSRGRYYNRIIKRKYDYLRKY